MPISNRAATINKVFKVLKKHYKPITLPARTLIENLIYGCCLEDANYEAASDCYARLQESYFDWNEVRVTTVRELGEIFKDIPNSTANALNLKNTLQSVFESQYSFDLDHLKKQNLGKAQSLLDSYKGTTQFTRALATQLNLGGHAIPLGTGGIDVMYITGVIDEKEAATGSVPGLERAIPKTKGWEFGTLLHQLAADLIASPFSQKVRGILLEIDPDCKPRLPKRVDKKKLEAERKKKEQEERERREAERAAAQKKAEAAAKAKAAEKRRAAAAAAAANPKSAAAKAPAKKAAAPKKVAPKKGAAPKKAVKKKAAAKKATAPKKKAAAKKKPTKKKAAPKKGAGGKKKIVKKATKKAGKKSASKQLARRKPR